MTRIHCSGPDHWTPRAPRSDADRRAWHGRILPMDRPEGEPSFFTGLFAVASFLVVAVSLIAVWSA